MLYHPIGSTNATGITQKHAFAGRTFVTFQMPIQPGYADTREFSAVVIAIGAAVTYRQVCVVNRHVIDGLIIALAVRISDIGGAAVEVSNRGVHTRIHILTRIQQAAVHRYHCGEARITGSVQRHQTATGITHDCHMFSIHTIVVWAAGIGGFIRRPINSSDVGGAVIWIAATAVRRAVGNYQITVGGNFREEFRRA